MVSKIVSQLGTAGNQLKHWVFFAGDAFSGMEWMTEKIDLSDFDLDSLIGSCDLDEPPSSPEELLASLESQMDLDLAPLPFPPSSSSSDPEELDLPSLPLNLPLPESPRDLPEPPADPEICLEPVSVEIKSEPLSPAFTLELGSEVDISELEKAVSKASSDQQTPSIVLSLSPAHIVVVLAPKEEVSVVSSSCADQSDSGIESISGSPPHNPSPAPSPKPVGASRTKPYSKPDPDAGQIVAGKVKTVSGTSKTADKKLKKMEQNKTAATRYRQKKRVEQESLNVECTELENRNRELAEKADSISREIQYLKDLIEEVRSAKNRKSKAKAESP